MRAAKLTKAQKLIVAGAEGMSKAEKRAFLKDALASNTVSGPLGSRHEGKPVRHNKVAADKAEVAKEGMGLALCKAMEAEQVTVRKTLVAILENNVATITLARTEIEGYRDDRRAEYGKKKVDRKTIRSMEANYQRPISILKYCAKVKEEGGDIKHILKEQSLHRMYALCTVKKRAGKKAERPMTQDQFDKYLQGISRIVPEAPKNGTETDVQKHQAGILRLEVLFRHVVTALAKHEHEVSIPVDKIVDLSKRVKSGKGRIAEVKRAA